MRPPSTPPTCAGRPICGQAMAKRRKSNSRNCSFIRRSAPPSRRARWHCSVWLALAPSPEIRPARSEEHTSELQSHVNLVCRLLLEKKKKKKITNNKNILHEHITQ